MAANTIQLQNNLQKPYDRILFAKEVLGPVFSSGFTLSAGLVPATVAPNKSESVAIDKVWVYGHIQLDDSTEITCYEVLLQPKVRIEQSKVAIQQYVRKLLTAGQVALINFVAPANKNVWRLTLVAKDSTLTDTGVKEKTTNAKRYTFLLGPSETCKTAAERFETLSTEKEVTFQTLVNAFSVEKLSKAFFDEYTLHYQTFCDYLQDSNYRKSVFNITFPEGATKQEKDKASKPIRDFVKKLLGRIVFLYFVQKKGWLGASDMDYTDGMGDFIKQLFNKSGGNEAFYSNWLSVLFFDTLNKERANDGFAMPGGKLVKVPFLNGGLFDKEDFDEHILTFKSNMFHHPDFEEDILTAKSNGNARGFLDFLDAFNFTVYEDSPDDHTVAVDPEMLGHIFENLLEDNKDKGAFYTPKEIVHYMCQESLIEYLLTGLQKEYTVYKQLGNQQVELFGNEARSGQLKIIEELGEKALDRDEVAFIIKHKDISKLTHKQLWAIDKLLDTVKICDPAIGSGAFPMGLLQEIFSIKELIAYQTGKDWKPAETKLNIIQNSVYGVDIEKGAVDIARLRFWLSLVVDEEKPKPLPNLDYKIVVGDSLVSKFDGEIVEIDWERKHSVGKAHEYVKNVQQLLVEVADKQKKYFNPNQTNKKKLQAEIRNLKIELLINQLSFNKELYMGKTVQKGGFMPTPADIKHNSERELQIAGFDKLLDKLKSLLKNHDEPFNHFDWKLDFPEVLNPYLVEGKGGFDIVIGNPPFIKVQSIPKDLINYFKDSFKSSTGKYDIYVIFLEQSFSLLKNEGNIAFINPHRCLTADYGKGLRDLFFRKRALSKMVYFGVNQIFETATTYTGLFFLKENSEKFYFAIPESKNLNAIKYFEKEYSSPTFNFSVKDNNDPILSRIYSYKKVSEIFDGVYQGLIPMGDDIHVLEGQIKGNYFIGYSKALNETVKIESSIMKPLLKGENIQRYQNLISNIYIFYPHFTNQKGKTVPYSEDEMKVKFPLGYNYILNFKPELISKKLKYKTNPDFWYSLHRSREQFIFENPKLITPQLQNHPAFTYDIKGYYADAGGYIILEKKGDIVSLETYLAIFNSKLFYYFITKTSTPYSNNYYYFKTNYIEPFCIPNILSSLNNCFRTLVHYVTLFKDICLPNTTDQHISTFFEQLIDGMVYELYFPDLIKKHDCEIIKHLGELPGFADYMDDGQKTVICKNVYGRLSAEGHPVKANLANMKSIHEIGIIENA
jgi:hypothetical protein